MAERDGRWSRRKGEKKYDVYFFTSFRSIGDGVSGQSLCRLSSIHHSQHINNQTHFIPFMKKRLQKKLSLKNGKISFLQNKATFFCGEKKIVEYYHLLQTQHSSHPMLKYGIVRNGHFRFSAFPRTVKGVPLYAGVGLDYARELASVVLSLSQR